jgi:cell division protein ZapB
MVTGGPALNQEDLKILEGRIDDLIAACQRLKSENSSLKSEQDKLSTQHAKLVEKTRIARERIETMIGRLKALERS